MRGRSGTTSGHWDAVVIGSGPGGAMAADVLVRSGLRVLMLERGGWVPRGPHNREPDSAALLSPWYRQDVELQADTNGSPRPIGAFQCVGGQSVFYAGVAFRYREQDFAGCPEVLGTSGARWPFGYDDLEPYYGRAEKILGVSGADGEDPTEAPRSEPFPQRAPPLSPAGRALHEAARRLGLTPFRPPLAINRDPGKRPACSACGSCDGFACGTLAKGDAAGVITALAEEGLALRSGAAAVHLEAEQGRIVAVHAVDVATRRRFRVTADLVVLAAGALATPQLLLASGLHWHNPGGQVVGRYLTRHCNATVCGLFPDPPGGGVVPWKEFAVHDFYHGHAEFPELGGSIGNIQQTSLPAAMVRHCAPKLLRGLAGALLPRLMGLLVVSEDQPVATNRLAIDPGRSDAAGLPGLLIHHRYTPRDLRARRALVRVARRILRAAGAVAHVVRSIDTFSHALGTVRMGSDPRSSALDADGRFRGFANLIITDGSALPTSAAVNPSLTIAALALRAATHAIASRRWVDRDVRTERREAVHAFA